MEYGLIGEKLGHSFSKEIHNLIGDYSYELKEIPRDELESFVKAKDFNGINVTIPYKQQLIPYLDYIDESAEKIGAVNTVVNKDGKLYGYNTDFIGLKRLILKNGFNPEGKKVLILGTGGTCQTAKAVVSSLNAGEVFVVSRKASESSDSNSGSSCSGQITYQQAETQHKDAKFIINTTPCGMFPASDASPLNLEPFTQLEGLVDVIYNPLRTKLVLQAKSRGVNASGGLYMLVQQAIAASELFFDKTIDAKKADSIYKKILSGKQNIVLIGMPGAGKSTVGRLIAKDLMRTFVDTDMLITEREKMRPAEIISEKGESYFRNVETEIIKEISSRNGLVIATGGGAVLKPENVIYLKNNGVLFFIDRDISRIKPTSDRPLSNNDSKLKELYKVRYPIYTSCADFSIKSDDFISHTVAAIEEKL